MITIENSLYVVINEMRGQRAPQPRPLQNGFTDTSAYRVLGIHSASETSEAYLILANDSDEIWFISNRHVRAHGLFPDCSELHFPVDAISRVQPLRTAQAD